MLSIAKENLSQIFDLGQTNTEYTYDRRRIVMNVAETRAGEGIVAREIECMC